MAQLTERQPRLAPYWSERVDGFTRFAPLLGRILLSMIFLASGVMKFLNWDATAGYMASEGMPLVHVLLPAAAVVELVGGCSVLFGWFTRWGALALVVFLIPTTLIFHDFWAVPPEQMQNQMQHFMKNLAILGGLLVLAGFGAGPISCDARFDPPLGSR